MVVINLRDPDEWFDVTLAKRSLAWNQKMKQKMVNDNRFNFNEAIERETGIIRSFMDNVRDQIAA